MAWRTKSSTAPAASSPSSPFKERWRKALSAAGLHLESGAAFVLGRPPQAAAKGAVPSGSLAFDLANGCGGWPRGRVSELVGPPGAGKTACALAAVAAVQRAGGIAAYLDVEHGLNADFAARAGVDLDTLMVVHPRHGEEALSIVAELVASKSFDLVVVDSVAALVPERELLAGIGRGPPNQLARLMSASLRTLNAALGNSSTALLMVNQLRTHTFEEGGAQEVSAGGDALKYYAALRVDVRRTQLLSRDTDHGRQAVGQRSRLLVVKSKVGRPMEHVDVVISFDRGVDRARELIDVGLATGQIERRESTYFYDDTALGNHRQAMTRLRQSPELAARIDADVRRTVAHRPPPLTKSAEDAEDLNSSASCALTLVSST